MKTPRLERWRLQDFGEYTVAEGHVYDSDKFHDGEYIHTSCLRSYSIKEAKITTLNSTYLLGKPASRYRRPPEKDVVVITKAKYAKLVSKFLKMFNKGAKS
jgi:hypothetical protein